MLAILKQTYGDPFQNAYGVRYWSRDDSTKLVINPRSFYNEATSLDLSDSRACERFERLVHREHPATAGHCWEKPEPTPPDQIFTGSPIALADSDLTVAGIAYGADSSEVRRTLGQPTSVDSVTWSYSGLDVSWRDGRVEQMHLTTPERKTSRGLRVGERVVRATGLYGAPCTPGLYTYCRTVTREADVRGILLRVDSGIITDIHVGAVFAPD